MECSEEGRGPGGVLRSGNAPADKHARFVLRDQLNRLLVCCPDPAGQVNYADTSPTGIDAVARAQLRDLIPRETGCFGELSPCRAMSVADICRHAGAKRGRDLMLCGVERGLRDVAATCHNAKRSQQQWEWCANSSLHAFLECDPGWGSGYAEQQQVRRSIASSDPVPREHTRRVSAFAATRYGGSGALLRDQA